MFELIARGITDRRVAWAIVAITAVLTIVAGLLAGQVEQDDDVLAFLPPGNPDIATFLEINERFGGTDVAMVALEVGDVFDAGFLTQLEATSRALRDTPGLDNVLTLTSVMDFEKDEVNGGIIQSTLVDEIPTTDADMAALRAKVMSRDHIVGTLVSEDASSALILAFATPGSQPRDVAQGVRAAVETHMPDVRAYWGGAPFISTWIYETTQDDMAALTPWSVVAILLIMMLAFRDALGTVLGLTATVIGIMVSRAAMYGLGVTFNIVLSSMPVILFAIGSAYAIHMLSRYDAHARELGTTPEAVAQTVRETGPTVLAAGMTTVAGLLSFVMMDIEPMRTFGVFTALGIFTALMLSLTFVPAVMALYPRPTRGSTEGPLAPALRWLARRAATRRGVVGAVVGALFVAGLSAAGAVQARMDLAAFFEDDSEPAVAQAYLDDHFGGSQFLQLLVEGDLEQPEVLREVGRMADLIRTVPFVSNVQSIDGVVGIINDAMAGAQRVPDTSGQVGVLYRFLTADPSVSRLVTDDRTATVMQVRIGSSRAEDLDVVMNEVEALVAAQAITGYRVADVAGDPEAVRGRLIDRLSVRLEALGHQHGVATVPDLRTGLTAMLDAGAWTASPVGVAGDLKTFLLSGESWVPLSPEQAGAVATAVAELGRAPSSDALMGAAAAALDVPVDDPNVGDLDVVISGPLDNLWRRAEAVAAAEVAQRTLFVAAEGEAAARLGRALRATLEDLGVETALVAQPDAETRLTWTVNGMPVLYRGLSASVTANQYKSLAFALVLVYGIMTLLFRSPITGMLATAPTALTLVLVYGAMGVLGVHLDIGTSMLASIIIGAGVDYAVHLLDAFDAPADGSVADAAARAVTETAHAIWTNAFMVAAGFFVLTLGEARPLQNVGRLTTTAMVLAALSTFVVIPLLARKRRYRREL